MQVQNLEQLTALARDVQLYLEYQRAERKASTQSISAFSNDLHDYMRFAALVQMQDYLNPTKEEITGFRQFLHDRQLKPVSIRRKLSTVRCFYAFLEVEEKTHAPNVKEIELPKCEKRVPTVLSKTNVIKLLESPDHRDRYVFRDRSMLEFLYSTGCRVSEACAVEIGDLNLDDLSCRVFGKGSKERIVCFGAACASAVRLYLEAERPLLARGRNNRHLFLSGQGRPLTRELVWILIRKYGEREKISKQVSPHVLRHTCATHLVQGGCDIRHVQELLGHASIKSTETYVSCDAERMRAVHYQFHPRGKADPEPLTEQLTAALIAKLDMQLEESPDPVPAAVSAEKAVETNGVADAEAHE